MLSRLLFAADWDILGGSWGFFRVVLCMFVLCSQGAVSLQTAALNTQNRPGAAFSLEESKSESILALSKWSWCWL